MKTDYVLTRRALLGISVLFCTTLLLFGCQDSTTVGPELDSPVVAEEAGGSASAKPDCSPWPECKDDGGGDPPVATLTLAGSMQSTAFEVVVAKDSKRTLKVDNTNFTPKPTINMDFGIVNCVGIAGTHGGPAPVEGDGTFEDLVFQLTAEAEVANAKVIMYIDKPDLNSGEPGGHELLVRYDELVMELGKTFVMLGGWPGPIVVTETDLDEFTFTGPVVVWPGRDTGGISCTVTDPVVVTLTR